MRVPLIAFAFAGIILLGANAFDARAVCINEVLYDPSGADAGYEFVELFHAGNLPVELSGWRIEAGNGASEGSWSVQWEGAPGDRIEAGGFFLIAGALVAGDADARAPLALQNGPDAVRLSSPQRVEDRVGWGPLEFEEFREGSPAADVPGGWSLARVPDGNDTGDNAVDFQGRSRPSPGRSNAPAWSVELTRGRCDPPLLEPGETGALYVALANAGASALALPEMNARLECDPLRAQWQAPDASQLQPDESTELGWQLIVPDTMTSVASVPWRCEIEGPEGERVALEDRIRIGRGPMIISEIQYDPEGSEGEWVELWNRSPDTLSLSGWSLSDDSFTSTTLLGSRAVAPGECRIVAQKPDEFLRAHPGLEEEAMESRGGAWPSLNNSVDRERGYADQVILFNADGVPSDYVRYAPGDLDGGGISLERWIEKGRLVRPEVLVPCASAAGSSPGRAGLPEGNEPAREWRAEPNPFAPGVALDATSDQRRLCFVRIPSKAGSQVSADIYTLAGRRVATLAAEADAAGPVILAWDGRSSEGEPLPTGLYLVRAVVHDDTGGRTESHLVPLALVRDF